MRPIALLAAIWLFACGATPALHALGFSDYILHIGGGSIGRSSGAQMFFQQQGARSLLIRADSISGYRVLPEYMLLRTENSGENQQRKIGKNIRPGD